MNLNSLRWYLCASIIFAGVCSSLTLGQQCVHGLQQPERISAPKYRVGLRWRPEENPRSLFVQISVEPENFNRTGMIALAKQLNRDFHGEPQLDVIICDDYNLAKSPGLLLDIERREILLGLRGFYELDRASGTEAVRFSTERGKAYNEIKIDLSKSP